MACKTCQHTMTGLGTVKCGQRYFWCPRCGTLKSEFRGDQQEYIDWTPPAGWTRAMGVLKCLMDAIPLQLDTLKDAAGKILRDCDPERKESE